jgi:hypothetical protein
VSTVVAFLIVYAVLFVFYRPTLLFGATTTTGGDTGAYHYPLQVLIQDLLPHFKVTGWAPGWYAGMPMFTFYFPFPFLVAAALQTVIPYQVAFKLVTVLGVFSLPVVAYHFARSLKMQWPYPILASLFALAFLFGQSYSIYGGNIASTLAGEFSYMLSFAMCFLFLGTMCRAMRRGSKFDGLFVANCLCLTVVILSHAVTTLVLVFAVWGLLLAFPRRRALLYLLSVGVVGFALTAWWTIPFVADLKWTAQMTWTQLHSFGDVLPPALLPVAVVAVVGMGFALRRKERRLLPLAWITFVTLVLVYALPNGRLWNARVLPFFWFSLHLWAVYPVALLLRPSSHLVGGRRPGQAAILERICVPVVAILVAGFVITTAQPGVVRAELDALAGVLGMGQGTADRVANETVGAVIDWNYTGYESKPSYGVYQQINDFIANLTPPGRVMVEHSEAIDEFGTARAFELIPYWTTLDAKQGMGLAQATMEGTLMESSFTAPFHFINQAELSKEPSDAIIGVTYPTLDVPAGLTHLQLMNIPYLLTVTPEVTNAVKTDGRATLLATFGEYSLFRIAGATGYVQLMQNQPVRLSVPQPEWRDLAVKWYENPADLTTPIVWDQGQEPLKQFTSVSPQEATAPPAVPPDTTGTVTNVQLTNDTLSFDTTAIGVPHWIKISYFPNWHAKGAYGPFLASPSFMMVIPTQSHVTLYYGRTWANDLGQVLEVLGWLLLAGLGAWRLARRLRRHGRRRKATRGESHEA